MILEYLFFDKNKRPQVESFNRELKTHKSKAKKDDSLPEITYTDFDKADYWIVKYEKKENTESVAKQFSAISAKICKEFSPTILTDECSEYFNKSLYPLVNKFERRLRKLLYLKVTLLNEEKLKNAIFVIEKKDFGNIYDILFVDHDFRTKTRNEIKELDTRAEMLEAINKIPERTAWDILIGDSILTIIKNNFDQLKEYRNDVMHAHNMDYDKFMAAKKLFSDANSELEQQIAQCSPVTTETHVSSDDLYDRLSASSDESKQILAGAARFLDMLAQLSVETTPESETLSHLGKLLMHFSMVDDSRTSDNLSSKTSADIKTEMAGYNEIEVTPHE